MFSPSEVLELVMLYRQTAHSATDFSPMDGNAKLKKWEPTYSRRKEKCRCTSIRLVGQLPPRFRSAACCAHSPFAKLFASRLSSSEATCRKHVLYSAELEAFGLRGLDKLAGILFDVFQRWLCSSKTFAHRLAMLGEASRLPSRGRSRTSRDNS